MVVPSYVVRGLLRVLHGRAVAYPVPPELRGWSFDRPPVRPRAYLGLSVWEVASYCPTRRDVWLRRVAGVRPSSVPEALTFGSDVHEVVSRVLRGLRKCAVNEDLLDCGGVIEDVVKGFEGREWFSKLADLARLVHGLVLADYLWGRYGEGSHPLIEALTEVVVDGSPLGLSRRIRADAVVGGSVVVEVKVGRPQYAHNLTATAYAMALEANLEVPIDYAVLVHITHNGSPHIGVTGIYIGPDERRDFLDARDEAIDIALSQKEPPIPKECPRTCPYREVCRGG